MEQYRYTLECCNCECCVDLTVNDQDEFPCFCPMCGSDTNDDWKELQEIEAEQRKDADKEE